MNRILSIIGISAVLATLCIGIAGATGTNISCNGAIHGAFANTNGNFGYLGANNGAIAQGIGGGVPVSGSAGSNNAGAAAYCNGT